MHYLTPIPKQFVDQSGIPYSGGKVYVYNAGDTTFARIYSSATSDELVSNPFPLDSSGSWQCFVNADEPLDYVVKDAQGNVVSHFEKVVPGGDGSGSDRTTVTSEDGSIDIQESYSEETRTRRFDLAVSDSVVSSARFSETGAHAGPDGTHDYTSLVESRRVGDDIFLRNGRLSLNRGTYHVTVNVLLENGEVDGNYYEAAISVLGISGKALWDNSFVHSESIEVSLDIVVDSDNTAVVPEISGLPSGISCGLSNMDVHKICVGPKGDRGEVGPMPDLDQSVPDNSEATESAPSTAAVFDFAVAGVKVNGTELTKGADKKVDVPVPTASSTTPAMDGVASAGSEEHWAKGDHVHPTDTSREAVSNKVTSWSSTLSDTNYPSEKLVKDTLDNLPPGTAVKGDAESEYRTGNVNLTPANIGAATASQGTKADSAVQGVKVNGTELSKDSNNNVSIPDGTTVQKGVVQLNNAIDSTSTTEAATPKAVKDAYDELNSKIVARAVFLSASEWSAQSLLPGDPAKVYYVEDGTGEDAYTVYVWKESTSAYVEVDESSIDLDGYWHDGPSSSGTGNVVTGMSLGNDGVPVLEKNLTAATLDSNGTVPVSQIPDSIKDKIVFIDGSISRTIVGAQYVYTVTCSTTYSEITQLLSSGKVPICKFTATFGNSSRTWFFYYHVTFDNLKHSFGSVDNNDTSGDEASYVSCVYVKTDNSWTFIEIANYDRSYWTDALAGKQNTISDLSTIRSGASAGASALQPSGDGSNLSVTPDGSSTGYDLGNSTTLKSFAQKFINLVSSLKALAFKDTADKTDLSQAVQTSLGKADTALQPSDVASSVTSGDTTHVPTSAAVYEHLNSFIVRGLGNVAVVYKPLTEVWDENNRGLFKLQYAVTDYFGEYFIEIQCKGTITSSNPLGDAGFVKVYSNFTQNLGKDIVRYAIVENYVVFGFSISSTNRNMCLEVCGHSVFAAAIKNLNNYSFTVIDVNDAFWSVKSKADGTSVGSTSIPVYVDSKGEVKPCNAYATSISSSSTDDTAATPKAVFNYDLRAKTFYNNSTSSAIYWKIATIDIATVSSRLGLIAFVSWRTANVNFTGSGEVRVSLAEDGGRGVVGQFTIDFERVDGTAQQGAIKFYAVSNGDKYELWARIGAYGVLAVNELLCNVNSITYSTTTSSTEPGTALPIKFALKSTADAAVGSTSQPVYVDENGQVQPCDYAISVNPGGTPGSDANTLYFC